MTTKQIIQEMEKEFDERFTMQLSKELTAVTPWATLSEIRAFIKKRTRTLLESFGEEIIGGYIECPNCDNNEQFEDEKCHYEVNKLKNQQRLKVKEILEVIK